MLMSVLNICQMITELRPAGAERCVYELATRLDATRFNVRVIALGTGRVAEDLRSLGVRVDVLNVRGKWDLPRLARLVPLLRTPRVDVLHTHLFHADVVGRCASVMAGVGKVVHTIHVAEARYRPWHFAWARAARWKCEKLICVSHGVERFHRRKTGLRGDDYCVIHNGIDVDAFETDPSRRVDARARMGIGEGDFVVVFVGRLDRQKGLTTLLQAARLLSNRHGMRFLIAGQGPLRQYAEDFIRDNRLGNVRLLGYVSPIASLYAAADAFAMPSMWEGFGLSAGEAQASGVPVVASRVAGLEEVVGDAGLLIAPGDSDQLARCLVRLREDENLRASVGRAGLQRVRELFSMKRYIAEHERLYEGLYAQRPDQHTRAGAQV